MTPGGWSKAEDTEARRAVNRRKKALGVPSEGAVKIATLARQPGPGVISEPLKKGSTYCPKCCRKTDQFRRCWPCMEWVCDCGGVTGSPYISCCQPCVLKAEESVDERKRVLAAWVERVKARA